jgi:(1->4)-alpha-D-glucan 1-alpha-D-glucosylmutase
VNGRVAPDGNEEYLLYQIMVATWPLEPFTERSRQDYVKRIQAYMTKALNEAKTNTRWDRRNKSWEAAVLRFIETVIIAPKQEFKDLFTRITALVAELGAMNSLSQTLIKMASPGVPDFYQGNELWHFILVDPDNRCQIDYEVRRRLLAGLERMTPAELLKDWRSGAIKMFLIKTLLRFRREHPDLFKAGDYRPLRCTGTFSDCCLAFARVSPRRTLLILAPRTSGKVGFPPVGALWKDTMVELPPWGSGSYHGLFTGMRFSTGAVPIGEVLRNLPFAALVSD